MPSSDRAPAPRPEAREPSGSLWAPTEHRAIPGIDRVVVRAPTSGELKMLRERADEAERNSPFVDEVPAETLRRILR